MTVRGRILAIRLAEKVGRQNDYAERIGIVVELKKRNKNCAAEQTGEEE